MSPAHLLTGTRQEMIAYMVAEGRFMRGIPRALASARSRPGSRLGIRHARDVAQAAAYGATHAQIAAQYGVHESAVGHALGRWRKAGVI